MIQKVSELTTEPIVGKYYLVECAKYFRWWVPIIGAAHEDSDLGVEQVHYHKDVRFNIPVGLQEYSPALEMGLVLPDESVLQITLKRRKCVRQMPVMREVRNFDRLEKIYLGKKACGKCPHRGMSLDSLPKRPDGTIICNGHGLAIRDGVVVKR